MRSLFVTAGLFVAASAFAQDAGAGWRTYANARFGVAVDYPAVFSVRGAEPENGDGQSFETADGAAKLRVYGGYNAERRTPAELLEAYKTAGVRYAYAASGRGWFALSGVKDGEIGYLRCNLGAGDVVGCFEIRYPEAQAARWAPVVERLGRSLRLGRVGPSMKSG